MRDLALRLISMRCLDGVELVHSDADVGLIRGLYGTNGPDWFCYRSDRCKEEMIRQAVDLEDALVVRFINANDDDKRIAFLSRFGLPDVLLGIRGIGASFTEPRNFILGRQRILRGLLERACSGENAEAIKAANEALARVQGEQFSLDGGRMVLTIRYLMSFMRVEIAIAAANSARLAACKRCRDLFLTGPLTKRRSTSKYCSDRCRVGEHRSNKLARGG